MQRLGNVLIRRRLACCGVLLASLGGCGGSEFTPAAGGAASGGSDAGGQGAGGSSGGSSPQGGDVNAGASAGGSSGSGGSDTSDCNCKAGQYCRKGSTDCFACTELSRLRFGKPERLSTLSDSVQDARFPRIGSTSTDLLYFFEGVGIRYTTDASTSAGGAVESTMPQDNGPLLLTTGGLAVGQVMGSNFLFDRLQDGRRRLYVGRWSGGLEEAELAPAPFNSEGNDFSIAVATSPGGEATPRAFWMTDRGMLGAELVTALASDSIETPVALQLGNKACTLGAPGVGSEALDLTPWVTSDGRALLLGHTSLDATCAPADSGKDLYIAPLQPDTGQPTLPATLLSDVNSAKDDVDPSFSADMCDLYFASNRDGDAFALYRAHRQ